MDESKAQKIILDFCKKESSGTYSEEAEKYYKLATKVCPHVAFPYQGLGYIYYYGRLGTPNYKKHLNVILKVLK